MVSRGTNWQLSSPLSETTALLVKQVHRGHVALLNGQNTLGAVEGSMYIFVGDRVYARIMVCVWHVEEHIVT